MLIELNIRNFALIQELSVEFGAGFNILSGETGAGKSILIDTIDYVLGGKFSKDLIRYGEDKTFVEAIFTIENDDIYEILEEFNIEKDDLIIISRESTVSGKNIIKLNGKSIVLSQLKKIRENAYAYIHGHSVGGTNPSLLESLSSTKVNILYDVGFNKECGSNGALYFNREKGNLAKILEKSEKLSKDEIFELDNKSTNQVATRYNWPYIIERYEKLFLED